MIILKKKYLQSFIHNYQNYIHKYNNIIKQLKGINVDYHELSTPLTNESFLNTYRGSIYGLSHNPERFSFKQAEFLTASIIIYKIRNTS